MAADRTPVLASRVRRRIVDYLTQRAEQHPQTPAGSAGASAGDLAAYLGLHVTTARFHLDQLVAAGFVGTHWERPTRAGRPRKLYAALPAQPGLPAGGRPYQALAALLAETMPAPGQTEAVSPEEAGERWAREHADPATASDSPATSPGRWLSKVGDMVDLLQEWGYTPEVTTSHGGRTVSIQLDDCPFLPLARRRPDVVCSIHRGLITGALAHVGEVRAKVELLPFVAPTRCVAKVTTATPFTATLDPAAGAPDPSTATLDPSTAGAPADAPKAPAAAPHAPPAEPSSATAPHPTDRVRPDEGVTA